MKKINTIVVFLLIDYSDFGGIISASVFGTAFVVCPESQVIASIAWRISWIAASAFASISHEERDHVCVDQVCIDHVSIVPESISSEDIDPDCVSAVLGVDWFIHPVKRKMIAKEKRREYIVQRKK